MNPDENADIVPQTPRPVRPRGDNAALLTTARSQVSDIAPWISRPLFRCPVLDYSHAGHHGTDGRGRIYIDFANLGEDDVPGKKASRLAANLLIALWRILREHDTRAGASKDNPVWDLSSSAICTRDTLKTFLGTYSLPYVENDASLGVSTSDLMPTPCHTPKSLITAFDLDISTAVFRGHGHETLTVEELFVALNQHADDSDEGEEGSGDGQGQTGEDSSEGSGQGDSAEDDSDSAGDGGHSDSPDGSDSGVSGNADNSDLSDQGFPDADFRTIDPGTQDDPWNQDSATKGLSATDRELLKNIAAKAITDAMNTGQGNALPESVTEWASDVLVPTKLDPHEFCKQQVRGVLDHSRTGTRGSYRRRSRRQSAVGGNIIMRGRVNDIKTLYVGIDVSGSRSDDELIHDFSELTNLATERGLEVKYFSVSTMPHGVRDLPRGERPVLDRDQAGTDMRVAFDVFDIHDAKLRLLITDGFTGWPTEVPKGTFNIIAITSPTPELYESVSETIHIPGVKVVWLPPPDQDPASA